MFAKRLAFLLSVAVFMSACTTAPTNRRPTPTPVPTLVSYEKPLFTVERGSIISEKELGGEIAPAQQEMLFFRSSGYINRVTVKRGDNVKKGDLLAELQVDDLLNQLQQAKIDLGVAQSNLAKEKNQRQYAIQKSAIDLQIARERLELARIDVENTRTSPAYDRAMVNYRIAEQNVKAAELNLWQASDLSNLQQDQVIERQKLAVQRLEGLLAEKQIIAPFDGIITSVVIQAGKQATAFDRAIEMGDPNNPVIRARPDMELRSSMDRDTWVDMSFSLQGQERYTIHYLPDYVPFSNLLTTSQQAFVQDYMYFTVPAELPLSRLKIGSPVYLNIVIGQHDNVLLLHPSAIRNYRGLNFVIVQDGERRRRVEISKIGLQTLERVEIEAELQPGDKVVGP